MGDAGMNDASGVRTLDVALDWALPSLGKRVIPSGGRVEVSSAHESWTEHDTAAADLARLGLVLSRGTGTATWTLTADGSTTSFPAAGRGVPAEVRDLLLGARTGAALRPLRRVATERTTHHVLGPDGAELGEIADVHEHITQAGDAVDIVQRRRVEISGWDGPFVNAVATRLAKSGATEAASAATDAGSHSTGGTVGAAVHAYLCAQHDAIVRGDLGLRRGENTVHRTRVAVRRLRSVLRAVDVAEPDRVAPLDAELSWLSGLLGAVRDHQVLREHLHSGAGELDVDVAAALALIDRALDVDEATARAELDAAMAGGRYLALLRSLREWRTDPPFTADSGQPEAKLARYVRAVTRDLDKLLARADGAPERLHRARKAAKRARYVATLAGSAAGKHGTDLARRAKALQTDLGDHQDCIVAAQFLERITADATGRAAFGCGVLWLHEQDRADAALRRATG